jgi:hypothetical protein
VTDELAVLLACVRERDWRLPPPDLRLPADLTGLPAAADHHRVSGCTAAGLRDVDGVPADVVAALAAQRDRDLSRHLLALADLAAVAAVLDPLGVDWLVLKGPALAERAYARPELRGYKDLDLLVRPAHFGRALRALEEADVPVLDRNWLLLRREQRGQVHLQGPLGTLVDLHWHVLNRLRTGAHVDLDGLHDRAVTADLGGVRARVLAPTDLLLHVAVHAALSGGTRLVWVKDVERGASDPAVDWDALVRRAEQWELARPVGGMLHRAVSLLDAPVPGEVLTRLGGGRRHWRGREPTGLGPTALAARVRTGGVRRTARAALSRARLGTDAATTGPYVLLARGGAEDRRAFLDMVAAAGRRGAP